MIDTIAMTAYLTVDSSRIQSYIKKMNYVMQRVSDKSYEQAWIIKSHSMNLMSVKWSPYRTDKLPAISVFCNPKLFGKFYILEKTLKEMFGSTDFRLNRIDFCEDIDIPVHYLHSSIKVKYKQNIETYFEEKNTGRSGRLTGFYLGSSNNLLTVYDKGYERFKKRLKKSKENICSVGVESRIEVRLKNNKLPFRSFEEIEEYRDFNPFESIQMYEKAIDVPKQRTAQALAFLISEVGLQQAYQAISKKGKFKRDYELYFSERNISEELYKHHLKMV